MLKTVRKFSTTCTLLATLTASTLTTFCPILSPTVCPTLLPLMAILGIISLKTSPCAASIPPHLLTNDDYDSYARPREIVLFFPSYQNMGRGQDARSIQPVQPNIEITSADVGQVIPFQKMQGLQTTAVNPNAPVMTTIFGYSMGNYLQSPAVKQSRVGRTATTVQESMRTEASFGGSQPGATKHSLAVNLNPFETKAEMKYKGFTNASLTYTATDAKLNFEMYRDISKQTKIVFNHTDTRSESKQMVSLRWIWF